MQYCRTIITTESFELQKNLHHFHPTEYHLNWERLMQLGRRFVELNTDEPQIFYIWGHSYEFNNMDNWEVMEEFCEKMKKRREVWYATNIEIYDYVEASRRLHISANCKMIHNPSAIPVWIRDTSANKIREIEPGATITL